MTFMIRRYPR